MRPLSIFLFSIPLLTALVACSSEELTAPGGRSAWVTIPPQQSIVESMVGDDWSVRVMVRPGESPEMYSPSPIQMAALAKADIYFGIGMPLERRIIAKLESSMPRLSFIQSGKPADEENADGHHHDADCVHGSEDPHVWMDPVWMQGFVEEVRRSLVQLAPESAEMIDQKAASLKARLADLDADIEAQLGPYAGRAFYINHPSLGHFAQRYGLRQKTLEHSGSTPSARQLRSIKMAAEADGVGAVFTQPEFGRTSSEILAKALNVDLIVLDVLNPDYFSNMRAISQALHDSFQR